MLLKYFYDPKLAHASYLVGCQATGEAIVVDPGRDIEPYIREAEAHEMCIVAATETHIHADFVSGARELAERSGAKLYLSDEGDVNWKYQYLDDYDHQLVKDGDTFPIGRLTFAVMHTPGHTPEHISLTLTDKGGGADKPMGIFTGDFIFVGSIGRPDLLEKAAGIEGTAVAGAHQMFKSVERFKALPDYLQVWPAHGAGSACGKGLGAIPSTTVGYEKLFNPALAYDTEEAFVAYLLSDQPEAPRYFAVMKRVNRDGPAVLRDLPKLELLPAKRILALLAAGEQVIDTRPAGSFAGRHIAGTINIPFDMLASWAGWIVDYERPLYLIAAPEHAREVVRDLTYIGIDKVAGYFVPEAVATLSEAGVPLQAYQVMTPDKVAQRVLAGDYLVVDVRYETEWDEGHIPGAQHVMLGYLQENATKIVDGKPIVVHCLTGARSAIGSSILQANGAEVINMQGGLRDWIAAELPIVNASLPL